jgi:hypothetical protein
MFGEFIVTGIFLRKGSIRTQKRGGTIVLPMVEGPYIQKALGLSAKNRSSPGFACPSQGWGS